MRVTWQRIPGLKDLEIKSHVLDLPKALDTAWTIGEDRQVGASIQLDGMDRKILFNIGSIFTGLGNSWRTIFEKGGPEDLTLLKLYVRTYYKYLGEVPKIAIDIISNRNSGEAEILRNRIISRSEESLETIWKDIVPQFPDAREIVLGTEESQKNAEIQLLFGKDYQIKDSPQKNDIVNQGIFLMVNGGVQLSYGINRLVCTNGLVVRNRLWDGSLLKGMREESLQEITKLVGWLEKLPNRPVQHVRELSILLDQFSPKVIKRFWKQWSEKIELKKLTFYDVVADITMSANDTLGYTRQASLGIRQHFRRIEDECTCPVCSAKIK